MVKELIAKIYYRKLPRQLRNWLYWNFEFFQKLEPPKRREVVVCGNKPLKLIMPPQETQQEVRVFLGNLGPGIVKHPSRKWFEFWKPRYILEYCTVYFDEPRWIKSKSKPINFVFQTTEEDTLIKTNKEIKVNWKKWPPNGL